MMCLTLATLPASAEEAYSVGVCFTTITDPIFAECSDILEKKGAEMGWDVVVLDCKYVAATQISQVENLIEKQVDAIVIYPAEQAALNEVCQKAADAGIKIMSWDLNLDCENTAYLVRNYDVGYAIGSASAEWINANYPEGCEVAILDYASVPVIVERADGIIAAINELSPKASIVAQDSAADVSVGMTVSETMLQAHPNIRVFACIGDGGAIGANEALKAEGVNLDEYGVFGCDASVEAMAAIANGEAIRATISLGSAADFADKVFETVITMMTKTEYDKEIYKVSTPVTAGNLSEFYTPAN